MRKIEEAKEKLLEEMCDVIKNFREIYFEYKGVCKHILRE